MALALEHVAATHQEHRPDQDQVAQRICVEGEGEAGERGETARDLRTDESGDGREHGVHRHDRTDILRRDEFRQDRLGNRPLEHSDRAEQDREHDACGRLSRSAFTRRPSPKASAPEASDVPMRTVRLSSRSAMVPPHDPSTSRGSVCKAMTSGTTDLLSEMRRTRSTWAKPWAIVPV